MRPSTNTKRKKVVPNEPKGRWSRRKESLVRGMKGGVVRKYKRRKIEDIAEVVSMILSAPKPTFGSLGIHAPWHWSMRLKGIVDSAQILAPYIQGGLQEKEVDSCQNEHILYRWFYSLKAHVKRILLWCLITLGMCLSNFSFLHLDKHILMYSPEKHVGLRQYSCSVYSKCSTPQNATANGECLVTPTATATNYTTTTTTANTTTP